ncbi:MAG: hypothetical protein O3A53_09335, partial [Acidobacteria bacterium]|nr:hypothetical protein [Acidobacteriota bacterium]
IRGSAAQFALRSAGYLALTAGVGSYALLGQGWPRFFLFSFLICAIPIGGLCLLLQWLDRIVLDDASCVVRRPLRRPILYDAVGGFHIHSAGGMASLTTAKGGPILLYSYDPAGSARLEQEMRLRWPDAVLRHSSSSSLWLLLGLIGLPLALGGAFSWMLSERFSGLREPCTSVGWSIESSGPRDQQIGPFTIGVPAGFTLRPGGMMVFGSETAEILYSIEPAMSDVFVRAILRYGLGVEGSADMIRWGACATGGVLPLTAKATLFGVESTQRLLFEGGVAILRQTKDGGNAHLAFVGPAETDLIVTVDFARTIDNELLERIISLVGIGPQRLARRTD